MNERPARTVANSKVKVFGEGRLPCITGTFGLPEARARQFHGMVDYRGSGAVSGNVLIDYRFVNGWHEREIGEARLELEISAKIAGDLVLATTRKGETLPGSLGVFVQRSINGGLLIGDHTSGGGAEKRLYLNTALSIPLAIEFFGYANCCDRLELTIGPDTSTVDADENHAHMYLWDREVNGVRHVRIRGVSSTQETLLGHHVE